MKILEGNYLLFLYKNKKVCLSSHLTFFNILFLRLNFYKSPYIYVYLNKNHTSKKINANFFYHQISK